MMLRHLHHSDGLFYALYYEGKGIKDNQYFPF